MTQIPEFVTTACIAISVSAPAIDLDPFRPATPNLPVKCLHTQRTACQVARIARDQDRVVLCAARRLDRAAVGIFGKLRRRAVSFVRLANTSSPSAGAADGDARRVNVPAPSG
jgi:hypothetical protein